MSEETYVVGDSGQAFDYEYLDSGGTATVMTGQTVQVIFQTPAGVLKTRAATLTAGASGVADTLARYVLVPSDFDEVGVWYREFHATGPLFVDTTVPISFYVGERLDGT